MEQPKGLVTHVGGCHCGSVRFQVQASENIEAIDCNCSLCYMKANYHFIVPESRFEIVKGKENLSTYTFNTHVAKHLFCKICGVQSFYRPRSNPDGVGVNPRCIDAGTIKSLKISKFDGQNWEHTMESSNIRELSKP